MSMNKVILIGRLGQDPEMKYTQNGTPVASMSIATSTFFKDKQGNRQEKTEWHSIVAWDKVAEIAHQYLKKGSQIQVEGRLQTRSWEKDGIKRYKTEIVVNNLGFLDSKSSGQGQQPPVAQHEEYIPAPPLHPNDDMPF